MLIFRIRPNRVQRVLEQTALRLDNEGILHLSNHIRELLFSIHDHGPNYVLTVQPSPVPYSGPVAQFVRALPDVFLQSTGSLMEYFEVFDDQSNDGWRRVALNDFLNRRTNYYVVQKDFMGLEKGTVIQPTKGYALVKNGKHTYDLTPNKNVVKAITAEEFEKNHKAAKLYVCPPNEKPKQ